MTLEPDLFVYRATVLRWIDGDTAELRIDLGLRIYHIERIRLVGPEGRYFDAWEKRGEERQRGLAAWDYARDFAPEGSEVLIRTYRDRKGKFGRYLAEVRHRETGADLATHMVGAGHGEWGS